MNRKMTIVVSGEDGDDSANITVHFDPAIGDEKVTGGFAGTANALLGAIRSLKGDVSDVTVEGDN